MKIFDKDLKDLGCDKTWCRCIQGVTLAVVVYAFVIFIVSAFFYGAI